MSECSHCIIGRVASRHDKVDVGDRIRKRCQRIVDGSESHRVGAFTFAYNRACANAGALHNPFAGETIDFEEMVVIDTSRWNIVACCVDIHKC